MLQALLIAFAMYSKIPMPPVAWNEKNMKYTLCYFPLVGAVIGLLSYLGASLCQWSHMHTFFTAVCLTLLPIFVTGGIHMDGFIDTVDALSSQASREKKLEILKDAHVGAFAIIFAVAYFLVYVAVFTEFSWEALPVFAFAFIMIRTLSGLSVVCFPLAKNTGLAATFQDRAHKKRVAWILLLLFVLELALVLCLDWLYGLVTVGVLLLMFGYHYWLCCKKFGGITGDLAGYFLQMSELAVAFALMVVAKVI